MPENQPNELEQSFVKVDKIDWQVDDMKLDTNQLSYSIKDLYQDPEWESTKVSGLLFEFNILVEWLKQLEWHSVSWDDLDTTITQKSLELNQIIEEHLKQWVNAEQYLSQEIASALNIDNLRFKPNPWSVIWIMMWLKERLFPYKNVVLNKNKTDKQIAQAGGWINQIINHTIF